MEGMGDVVVVKESKCLLIGDHVYIESCVMRVCLCVMILEVWNQD